MYVLLGHGPWHHPGVRGGGGREQETGNRLRHGFHRAPASSTHVAGGPRSRGRGVSQLRTPEGGSPSGTLAGLAAGTLGAPGDHHAHRRHRPSPGVAVTTRGERARARRVGRYARARVCVCVCLSMCVRTGCGAGALTATLAGVVVWLGWHAGSVTARARS